MNLLQRKPLLNQVCLSFRRDTLRVMMDERAPDNPNWINLEDQRRTEVIVQSTPVTTTGAYQGEKNHWVPFNFSRGTKNMQLKDQKRGTSLVVQWLRIHLPMQGTWVWALVQEDAICHGATKPVCHNYWSLHTLGPASHNYWAHTPQLLKPAHLEPVLRNKRSHRNEKPTHGNRDPMQPKKKKWPQFFFRT